MGGEISDSGQLARMWGQGLEHVCVYVRVSPDSPFPYPLQLRKC